MNIWKKINKEIDLIEDGFDLYRITPICKPYLVNLETERIIR
jgi:hypothetical protein